MTDMSNFGRAGVEIQALERRLKELERLARGKDGEIARLRSAPAAATAPALDFDEIYSLLCNPGSKTTAAEEDEILAKFIDSNQSLANGMNLIPLIGAEKHEQLAQALAKRLSSNTESVGLEHLRLAKGLYRETRTKAMQNVGFYLSRITLAEPNAAVREEAAKCLNNVMFQNCELRDALIANEQGVDLLLQALTGVAALVADSLVSSNSEARMHLLALKSLFQSSHGDELVARLFVKSGLFASIIARLAETYLDVERAAAAFGQSASFPLISTTCEGTSRGNLLVDGLRLVFILANFAQEDVLGALLTNEGKPVLSAEELERCNLAQPNLGVGDRYVFLQTQILLFQFNGVLADMQNLDQIKVRVCNLLMFAHRAPGFVAYLYRHGVGPKLVDLFYRQTQVVLDVKTTSLAKQEELLPLLLGLKTLVDDSNGDFLAQFQELFFAKLQPDLDASAFASKEEFNAEKERRHFAGRSVPDTPFGNCVALLTCYDENIKRMAGEFLYDLCEQDADMVTKLVGFGHAAHLLAIKGGMIEQIMANQAKANRSA